MGLDMGVGVRLDMGAGVERRAPAVLAAVSYRLTWGLARGDAQRSGLAGTAFIQGWIGAWPH